MPKAICVFSHETGATAQCNAGKFKASNELRVFFSLNSLCQNPLSYCILKLKLIGEAQSQTCTKSGDQSDDSASRDDSG
ncbi:hypothetical protein D7Y27_38605 [Corallococcus sp. AB004]|nr:hypothetical protein D7Y27_38605 [Corallococcus sp. AB004]